MLYIQGDENIKLQKYRKRYYFNNKLQLLSQHENLIIPYACTANYYKMSFKLV